MDDESDFEKICIKTMQYSRIMYVKVLGSLAVIALEVENDRVENGFYILLPGRSLAKF